MKYYTIDVARVIDSVKISPFQIFVITLCGLIAVLDGFDTQAIAFVAPKIATEWNVSRTLFGPVFSAGLLGLALGALVFSPVADKVGRRTVILISVALFGLFSWMTAYSATVEQLIVLRFVTGIGLGAAMPNLIALTAEYSPARTRSLCVTLMFCGFPLGAVLGGFLSNHLIAAYGWRHVFYAGGIAPLVLLPVFWLLPESIRFLVARGDKADRVASTLGRLGPATRYDKQTTFVLTEEPTHSAGVAGLFSEGRAVGTVMLWVAFFCNLLVMYFLINWMPTVLTQAGFALDKAILATILFNLGGVVGGILIGKLIDMWGANRVLIVAYLGGAACTLLLGFVAGELTTFLLVVFLAGVGLMGGQLGLNALAANYYPTRARSTGIGWALGIGRLGSIVGPLAGGFLLTLAWPLRDLYAIAAVPALLAAVAVFGISRKHRKAVVETVAVSVEQRQTA